MEINYTAEKTASRLHNSDKLVRGFLGPVGNGKTVACIMEMIRLAFDQWPNSKGVRKTRWVIVRNTNPELRTTTLNTWKQWVPENIAPVVMHPIITTTFRERLQDGTTIEMEVIFLAMDADRDVRKLLSFECTGGFVNEARELPYAVVKALRERSGRYPAEADGYVDVYDAVGELTYAAPRGEDGDYEPCKRKAILMDTNPPDDDHWWYQLAEDGCLKGAANKETAKREVDRIFDFFHGPPALLKSSDGEYSPNPKAENISHLPGGYSYYLDMIGGNTDDQISVMILGSYGTITDGRPVYNNYNDAVHCPEDGVPPIPGLPISLGWDFGLTPSCIIGQLTETAQMRVVAELTTEDMDVRTFARDVVKPYLQQHFSKYTIGFSLGDPSGNARGEGEGKSAIGILNDEYAEYEDEVLDMGFDTDPAPTNDPTRRIDAVNRFMVKMVNGEPGYLLGKDCKQLRKGKRGGYRYKRIAMAGSEDRYRDIPDKNAYSHPADAEQYLALGFVGGYVTKAGDDGEDEDVYHGETNALGY